LHELGAGNGSVGTGSSGAGAATITPSDPGALPLLSHALQATWEHRENRTLTVAGYHATGGIRGAIATTVEAIFQELDPAGQEATRRLLLRMVQIGDGVADTRLRADRNTLITHSPNPVAASAVFDAFAEARLITVDGDAAEITHEALLRAWPRFRGWIDADRAGLYVHQQLTAAAQGWDHDGRPISALYRGTALAVAQDWAQEPDHHSDLGTLERDFLATSRVRQQQASHRRAHRARRVRQSITGLVVLFILSLAGGGIVLYQSYFISPITVTGIAVMPVGDAPYGVAVTPDGRRAYITNFGSDSVSVIDTVNNTVTGTIAVGVGPYGVVVTPDGRVYITILGSDTVSVIDVDIR
ncbi:MAG: YncE family protein, partial [Pseudonocardiaceae bacterium]